MFKDALEEATKFRLRSYPWVGGCFWERWRADVEEYVSRGPYDDWRWETKRWHSSWTRARAEKLALRQWQKHLDEERRAVNLERVTVIG